MAQDALGNEVSRASAATLSGIDDFVTGFLGYEKKAGNIIAAADGEPDAVLANIYAGFTWMFLEAEGRGADGVALSAAARRPRRRARTSASGCCWRSSSAWIAGDVPTVQAHRR